MKITHKIINDEAKENKHNTPNELISTLKAVFGEQKNYMNQKFKNREQK